MKKIDNKTSIYKLIMDYPEIKDIMVELGFVDIIKPGMLESVGRVMNLEKGGKLKKIDTDNMIKIFERYDFDLFIL